MLRAIGPSLVGLICLGQEAWRTPFTPHRIVGNVYYVGSQDLAVYLITTPAGHILINSGLNDSAGFIREGIEALGFKPSDIKILTTMQAHYDHVAALAQFKKQTGAQMFATEMDAVLLEDGGASDYLLGKEYNFAPVKVDRKLKDGEKISLGGTELTVHLHPGHTKGSSSFTMRVKEGNRTYDVAFLNMGSINPGTQLIGNAKYPKISDDYSATFRKQKALPCEIFLSAHGQHYRMMDKYKPIYDPAAFVDPEGCRKAIERYEAVFAKEWAAQKQ